MIEIWWDPIAHVGRIPINWYGLGWRVAMSTLRFGLFFVRGDVPTVALGLTNGHALRIFAVAIATALWLKHRMSTATPMRYARGRA